MSGWKGTYPPRGKIRQKRWFWMVESPQKKRYMTVTISYECEVILIFADVSGWSIFLFPDLLMQGHFFRVLGRTLLEMYFFSRESQGLMPSFIVVHLNVFSSLRGSSCLPDPRDPYFRSSLITRSSYWHSQMFCAWVADRLRVSSHMGESHIKAPGEMRVPHGTQRWFFGGQLNCYVYVILTLLYLYLLCLYILFPYTLYHIILCILYSCMECME